MTAFPAKVQNLVRGLGMTVSRSASQRPLTRWWPTREVRDFPLPPYKRGRRGLNLLFEIEILLAIPPKYISTPARTTQDDCQ